MCHNIKAVPRNLDTINDTVPTKIKIEIAAYFEKHVFNFARTWCIQMGYRKCKDKAQTDGFNRSLGHKQTDHSRSSDLSSGMYCRVK
jgi:hypothetical protein